MPANNIADKVHNFLEQDNFCHPQQRSQVPCGEWPVVNSNPWLSNQQHNGTSLKSNPKNYNLQTPEPDRANGWPSSLIAHGTNHSQLASRRDFLENQLSIQQQFCLNGFVQNPQGFQTWTSCPESLGEDTTSKRNNLTLRNLDLLESQKSNASEQGPNVTRNSEGLETAKAPINFDFLGSQQTNMRNQQPGFPQPWLRQQPGVNEMQLRQQQFMYKQLQEFQRQQQLQQLDQEGRQQSSLSQMSGVVKQGDQLPTLVNGAPIHDAPNNMWQGQSMGGDSRIPISSQMLMLGNLNWAQRNGSPTMQGLPNGLMLPQEQSQVLRSMGFVPQQLDQSLYGAPVATSRGSMNHYSHFQGISSGGTDMLSKTGGNQVDKPMTQSSAFNAFQNEQSAVFSSQPGMLDGASLSRQGLQGKNMFGQIPVQTLHNGVMPENFQQVNPLSKNVQAQEFHDRQERTGWEGNLQEKAATQVGTSQSMVNLDPTEAKILFSSDEGIWDNSIGRFGGMNAGGCAPGNNLEVTDYLNVFPSVQSGSWSALMQSAVAEASSSDTGLHDEWSGLSFQKAELATGNRAALNDGVKQPTTWVDNDLQTASSLTSRPFPLFDDSNMSPSSRLHGFQQNSSHESLQRSPKEPKWLDQNPQKTLAAGGFQLQRPMHWDNNQGAWGSQVYEQSHEQSHGTAQSADMELNSQNMQGSWLQQNMSSYNISNQSCSKTNGWNINESLASNEGATMKILDNENGIQQAQGNPNSTSGFDQVKSRVSSPQVRTDIHMNDFNAPPHSNTLNITQGMNQQVQHGHQLNYGKHAMFDSSLYSGSENAVKHHQRSQGPDVQESSINTSEKGSGETYDKKHESYSQKEISDGQTPYPTQLTVGDGMRENSWSVASDTHPSVGSNQKSVGQIGRKSSGPRKFQFHPMGNLGVSPEPSDASKYATHALQGQVPDLQRNSRLEELPSRSAHGGYESNLSTPFDRASPFFNPNKRTLQTSQNMLELLHKVDQSRENNILTNVGSSNHNPSELPRETTTGGSVANLQHSQSSGPQGFGLRLAPPSQRPSTSNHTLSHSSSQMADDLNSRHIDQEGNSSGAVAPGVGISGNQLEQQHFSIASGQVASDQSLNLSFASQSNLDAHSKLVSHFRQMRDSYDGAEQSAQASLHGSGRMLPFNLAHPADVRGPVLSAQSYPSSVDNSQSMNVNSYPRGSGQQSSVSQLPITSGISHGGFSPVMHTAWTNIPSQRVSGGPSSKVPPNLFQSMHPSTNSLEATSWAQQKADDKVMNKGGNDLPEHRSCSINSQQFAYGEDQSRKDGFLQRIPPEKIDLGTDTAGSFGGNESTVHPHPQDHGRGNPWQGPSHIPQTEHVSQNTDNSSNEIESFGRSLKPSDDPHQKYSLLHQMHAMKGAETDSSWKSVKRLREDFGADAQQALAKTGQRVPYGHSTLLRDPMENELSSAAHHMQIPSSDPKMLCFSSERKEDQNVTASSHRHAGDLHSKDTTMFGRSDLQSYSSHLGKTPTSSLRGNEHPRINPQMAPSWFERYGTYKNGQILSSYDVDSSRRDAKVDAQRFLYSKDSEGSYAQMPIDQANAGNSSQTGGVWQNPVETVPSSEHLSSPHSWPSAAVDQTVAVARPKKRKSEMPGSLPWHKEITQGPDRLQSISMAEVDWAQATNRLIEKVEDEAEMIEDGPVFPRPRRRLILTTQLMQQLLRSLPSEILSADVSSEFESVTYFAAKVALGDTCSLISCSGGDSESKSDGRNMTSGKAKPSERAGVQFLAKVVEDFITRGKKLESDFLRLDKKASILDIRVECQDLERFSVINRFARFHGRGNADGIESSSSSEPTAQKSYPQRYVTALPVPRSLPEGVPCLSL